MKKTTLRVKRAFIYASACMVLLMAAGTLPAAPLVIDHDHTDITRIPRAAIELAKDTLHIAYGHTSHGSQLTTGMTGLVDFANGGGLGLALPEDGFAWNNGGTDGALDLHDYAMDGDVGYYPQWVENTRDYLDDASHTDVNVIIWSWCGQVADKYAAGTLESEYLAPMAKLEREYPHVTFVYMTGHVDIWDDANNKAANQTIRDFCEENDKVLYDFADIEHYDPDGQYYAYVSDDCGYYDGPGGSELGNWATEWQAAHTEGVDWYECTSAHSQPLNANRKAYAAWWLWAALAGWDADPDDGNDLCPDDPDKTAPGVCGCGVPDVDTDGDGTMDCQDACPDDPDKTDAGVCGCGVPDIDTDGDGSMDCEDACPNDPNKIQPGYCGCGNTEDSCDPSASEQTATFTLTDGVITYSFFSSGSISLSETTVDDETLESFYPALRATIDGVAADGTITLAIVYPRIPDAHQVYALLGNEWADLSDDAHVSIDYESGKVTITLVDGGFGDEDGLVNGEILNSTAIAQSIESVETHASESGGGGGGGCFIRSTAPF